MDSTTLKEVKYIPEKPDILTSDTKVQEFKPENGKKSDTLYLVAIVIGGSMLAVLSGEAYVWTSAVIPTLKSNNTEENPLGRSITVLELSLLAGLPSLSMLFGALIHGYVSEKIGRKRTLQLAGIGIVSSAISIAFSKKIILMIIIRCIWFFFFMGGLTVYPIYVTEICEDHNRARYGCLYSAFLPVGNLLGYSLGSLFSFRDFTLIGTLPFLIFLFFFFFAPESPVYTLSQCKKDKCIRTLRKLRNNKTEKEIHEDFIKMEATIKANASGKKPNILSLFETKERRYSLMLGSTLVSLHMFCGIGIILPFMEPIFLAAGTKFDSSSMPIYVAAVKIISFLLTSLVIEKAGKRLMLLISSIGIGVPLFVLGLFFHLKAVDSPFILQLQWLPLVCIISYIIFFSLGVGPVPGAIIGEFFTSDLRAAGLSVAMTFLGILSFLSSFTFPIIVEKFGMQWCMWLYSSFCVFGAIFIYLFIPETKGKTLIEIQDYIKSRCQK
ncbi:facilitated trehalose transporter Tret1-2 homolog [Diorhabda sublineata]|uniref:facilitated trehalose transporter Tret1-2 homolog n=1 Tax=Diorhabda sublineata TaxID=1163346 RepID=UPI0024E07221|nr:facilitated trehalose transporter Tret1-2 homolog [Diorhabda sublineata]